MVLGWTEVRWPHVTQPFVRARAAPCQKSWWQVSVSNEQGWECDQKHQMSISPPPAMAAPRHPPWSAWSTRDSLKLDRTPSTRRLAMPPHMPGAPLASCACVCPTHVVPAERSDAWRQAHRPAAFAALRKEPLRLWGVLFHSRN